MQKKNLYTPPASEEFLLHMEDPVCGSINLPAGNNDFTLVEDLSETDVAGDWVIN